jgi:hypothetical protein
MPSAAQSGTAFPRSQTAGEEKIVDAMSVLGPSRTLHDVRFMSAVGVLSGLDVLIQRFSECDPTRTLVALATG